MKNLNKENFRISPSIVDIEKPEFGAGNRGALQFYSPDEMPPVRKKKKKNKFNLVLGFKEFIKNVEEKS